MSIRAVGFYAREKPPSALTLFMAQQQLEEARETSPDWLREYEKPMEDIVDLSSSPTQSPDRNDYIADAMCENGNRSRRRRFQLSDSSASSESYHEGEEDEDDEIVLSARKRLKHEIPQSSSAFPREKEVAAVPSDEVEDTASPENEDELNAEHGEELTEVLDGANVVPDEASRKAETGEKRVKPKVNSALPLVFSDKIIRSKVLLECEGDALDMSGDIGAVGRVSVSDREKPEIYLDLKGTIYKTNIVPSNSFFLVNIGASEAKVEAIMNDFVQLKPDTNNNDIETMIEGSLEGMTFDSDDEGMNVAAPVSAPEENDDQKKNVRKSKVSKELKVTKKAPRTSKGNGKAPSKRGNGKAVKNKKTAKKSK